MAFYLIGISGKHRAGFWPITDTGLLIGRERGCDIALDDNAVSRRHCRIYQDGAFVKFEDLGSRNEALINGRPLRHTMLCPGDEIGVGSECFLIADDAPPMPAASPERLVDTISWRDAAPVILDIKSAKPATDTRPSTVQDLAWLYETTRDLTACADLLATVDLLRARLDGRFSPSGLWVALRHGREELTLWPDGGEAAHDALAPIDKMQTALQKGHGILAPSSERLAGIRVRAFTLVAPIMMGALQLGAVALRKQIPEGTYDEGDLRLLMLLAQSLAPILYAIENIEQLQRDNERLRARTGDSLTLIGESRGIRHVRGEILKAARSNLNVLITGETGTGKELVARLVHQHSAQHAEPFIVVNCAAIPRDLFESELFGYEKGAFTGATGRSAGLLSQAHGGTLFLDEIGDLSLDNQARILRAVEQGSFRRIGGKEEIRVSVRVVAATNKDIGAAIENGTFRDDLYHRLSGYEIAIPPLRERPSDIAILVEHFIGLARGQAKHPVTGIAEEALDQLRARAWHGNVRELRNCIFRAVTTARQGVITLHDVADTASRGVIGTADDQVLSLAETEKRHITAVIQRCSSLTEAAKVLQISRSTLYTKMAEYNIK